MQSIIRILAALTQAGVLYTVNYTRHKRPAVNLTINSGPGSPYTLTIKGTGN
jgi:hypothetical protein